MKTTWHTLMDRQIGVLPIPIYALLIALLGAFLYIGKMPSEICVAIAIICVGGYTCGEIGKHIPILKHFGSAAIFATFVPSYLVFAKLVPAPILEVTTNFTKQTNFLYLFIASIIVGSIFSMNREILVKGFIKIFAPLIVGTIVSMIVGLGVATALGLDPKESFFKLIVPIMAGGVGEGAIPLSVGLAPMMGVPQGDLFAQVLPIVMIASFIAVITSGALNFVGEKFPDLTGNGVLQPGTEHLNAPAQTEAKPVPVEDLAAAGACAVALYLVGLFSQKAFDLPGPVVMLFLAVMLKLAHGVSDRIINGAKYLYTFFSKAVTYPLLFMIGATMTPWDKLVESFTVINFIVIGSTVWSLMATGFVVGKLLKMYPIETAIVNACHSGQGGTGDIAILTAANRMSLMPFAQISTRIGGAIVVSLALLIYPYLT